MSEPVVIVHVSDLHARLDQTDSLECRVRALFADLERLEVKPDAVLVTGDIAYSGQADEYAIADKVFFSRLCARFDINRKQIHIVPGNHDVNWQHIHEPTEAGLRQLIVGPELADKYIDDAHARDRMRAYLDFEAGFHKVPASPFQLRTQVIRGLDIGFACLNSAWRCSGDSDKGFLFLSDRQVMSAVRDLAHCHLRIALLHHTYDWLHTSESLNLAHLKREFEVIATGHLHETVSLGESTPSSECLILSAPALLDGKGPVGYNIYRVDFETKCVHASYRRYVAKRDDFDMDIEHARGGEHEFRLPMTDLVKHGHGALCLRMDLTTSDLETKVKRALSALQQIDEPIYVNPRVRAVKWAEGGRVRHLQHEPFDPLASTMSFIRGGAESGKTVLLQALAADIDRAAVRERTNRLAVYVDLNRIPTNTIEAKINRTIGDTIPKDADMPPPSEVIICVDHVNDKTDHAIATLQTLVKANPNWRMVVAIQNQLMFDKLLAADDQIDGRYYELMDWGPSRIRELVSQYFKGLQIDADAAFEFVTNGLLECDLPATPVVVIIYLAVFRTLGNELSSLSFLHLLERFEMLRLGHSENSSANSLYNKQRVLARIAAECAHSGDIGLPYERARQIIEDYFSHKLLPLNLHRFLEDLKAAGVIEVDDDVVRFRYYVMFDYYLARAFALEIADVDASTSDLRECAMITGALALYGGLVQENTKLAEHLLGLIEASFNPGEECYLRDLDQHITDLLLAVEESDSPDKIASGDLDAHVDYEAMDEGYAEDRSGYVERRRTRKRPTAKNVDVEYLTTLIDGLKAFYNVFRNLEGIDGEDKIRLLGHILDYHIHCNMRLLDFYSAWLDDPDLRTVVAYLATMSGQVFLTTNIGSQGLRLAIDETLKRCRSDFKELLLLLLYSDLRLPGHERRLEEFVRRTDSRAAVEMVYLHIRGLCVQHEKTEYPVALISAFKAAFDKRVELHRGKVSRGALERAFSSTVLRVKTERLAQEGKTPGVEE